VIIVRSGWDTGQLAQAIASVDLQVTFDVVTLQIGVNNQFRDGTVSDFAEGLVGLVDSAIKFAGGDASRVILVSIPDWGVTPFAEGAPRRQIAEAIDEFNDAVREQAAKTGTRFVDVTEISRRVPREPELVASDGLHPSALMYAKWVELIIPEVIEVAG